MSVSPKFRKLCRIMILLLLSGVIGLLAGQVDDNDENFGLASLGAVQSSVDKVHSESARAVTVAPAETSQALEFFVRGELYISALSLPNTSPSLVVPLRT